VWAGLSPEVMEHAQMMSRTNGRVQPAAESIAEMLVYALTATFLLVGTSSGQGSSPECSSLDLDGASAAVSGTEVIMIVGIAECLQRRVIPSLYNHNLYLWLKGKFCCKHSVCCAGPCGS